MQRHFLKVGIELFGLMLKIKNSMLDKANDWSSHKGVVPKGGGIGILAAFFVGIVDIGTTTNIILDVCWAVL